MKSPQLMRILRWALALLACLGLITATAIAAEAVHVIKPEGRTDVIFTRLGGNVVRVTLWQTKVGSAYPYKDALLWGGDVGELPKIVLSSIQIQDGNETVFMPLSAYGDLGDVRSASLDSTTQQGFTLNLHGGDTAASYDAALNFERGYLVRRTVVLREFGVGGAMER